MQKGEGGERRDFEGSKKAKDVCLVKVDIIMIISIIIFPNI